MQAILDNIRDAKDFDLVQRDGQKPCQNRQQKESIKKKKWIENFRYNGIRHPQN